MTTIITVITPECLHCRKTGLLEIEGDVVQITEGFRAYQEGQYIQMALPMLTAEQREQVLTGVHPTCWALMGLDEEDEEEDVDFTALLGSMDEADSQ